MPKSNLIDSYQATYQPIVDAFCRDIDLDLAGLDKIPSPFIPLYGSGYEKSAIRIAFVGIDTVGWQDGVKAFVTANRENPKAWLGDLEWFHGKVHVSKWGNRRTTFWGFIMGLIADMYGIDDWGILKRGLRDDLLSSLAWGNVNAIEHFNSSSKGKGAPLDSWKLCREKSKPFLGVRPIIEAVRPNIMVILNASISPEGYFNGVAWEKCEDKDECRRYRLTDYGIDVLHVPHPNRMRWSGSESKCRSFLLDGLRSLGAVLEPGSMFMGGIESPFAQHMASNAPKDDKYKAVEWIAAELSKSNCVMSGQTLADLLNKIGFTTNYGSPYSGGRGTYRLIRGAHNRLIRDGREKAAGVVARSFVKPNGHYAYEA